MEDTLQSLTQKFINFFSNSSFYYICNDPERALGLEKIIPNFHVIYIDKSSYTEIFEKEKINHFCWQDHLPEGALTYRNSYKLLKSLEFAKYFAQTKSEVNYFQTFKISPAFMKKVKDFGGVLINTDASLNRRFEDKLSQFREISNLGISMPKGEILEIEKINYMDFLKKYGDKFVIQFDRGHTGSGTVFVKDEKDLDILKEKFPQREVRVAEFVHGVAYTFNAVVGSKGIYCGGLSRQITGVPELTINEGGTVGNDFYYRAELIKGIDQIIKDANLIGQSMQSAGYRGLFGLDIIIEPDGGHKIIEINARQPASIPFFTKIQIQNGQIPLSMIHIAEFSGIPYNIDPVKYSAEAMAPMEFSQIFVRSFKNYTLEFPLKSGIYRLQGDNAAIDRASAVVRPNTIFLDEDRDKALLFQKDGYSVNDIQTGGFLLLTPFKGRELKINDELGRIQIKGSAFNANGDLNGWIIDSLSAIKNYQS